MPASSSQTLWARMQERLAGGVSSPIRTCKAVGHSPIIARAGEGAYLIDVEGRRYVDFVCSWGALILGHAHPQVVRAIQHRVAGGTSFGMPVEEELLLAEAIQRQYPKMEQLRFVSSGTEACMSAIRLARGATGRNKILKFVGHYHGHADHLLVQAGSGVWGLTKTSSSAGVPPSFVEETLLAPWNSQAAVDLILNTPDLAAVICEPVTGNMGVIPPLPGYLQQLRDATRQTGALLILDEVITGFRLGPSGASGYYGIDPDLTCWGKIVGGGMPCAAFGGSREIMSCLAPTGPVYQAGTLSGNPVAMVAGLETLRQLQTPGVYERLDETVRVFTEPVQAALSQIGATGCIQQMGSMWTLFFGVSSVTDHEGTSRLDRDRYARYWRWMLANGFYLPPLAVEACFIGIQHTHAMMEEAAQATITFLEREVERIPEETEQLVGSQSS
ncbi:MAG: glutamate-1-semialdehyde 2,1-aminomutase [Chlamydiia bacterium]